MKKRRQSITIEIISENKKIKDEYTLLRQGYTPDSLISKLMNDALDTLKPIYLPQIEAIKKRKGLTIENVLKDEEVIALLKQKDREQLRFVRVLQDSFLGGKAGRPKGRKKSNKTYSQQELTAKLKAFIKSYFKSQGKEPTQQEAAKALGLSYEKKLKRLRRSYGDNSHWKEFVAEVLSTKR